MHECSVRSPFDIPTSTVCRPLGSSERRITNDNFLNTSKPSVKPELEEILVQAERVKGISDVVTIEYQKQVMSNEVEHLISKIKALLTKI